MSKRKLTLAFSLTLSLLLCQLPRASRASAASPAPSKKSSCPTCSAARDTQPPLADTLATLGRRTQPLPLKPLQRSIFEGVRVNFVSTATGSLAFSVTDLELGGALPVLFQRVYDSSRREDDSGLGAGWSFAFDDRVSIDGDAATLTTGVGARLAFRRSAQGQHFTLRDDEPGAHQSFDVAGDGTISEQAAGLTRTYKKIGAAYRLARIADANGNAVNIAFDSRANVASITSGAAAIAFEWSDAKDSRLLSVADNAGRRVAFKHDGQRLRAVTDAAGAEWTYGYVAERLTEAADPLARVLLRARYDKAGRAVESGDAAGVNSFEYESSSSAVSRRTLVADPLGAITLITHTNNGALASVSDGEGQSIAVEYNAANRAVRVANSFGGEVKFTYDQQQRIVQESSADGTNKSFSYDGRGRVAATSDGGARTEYVRDERGNITATRGSDPGSGYDAKYNAHGQVMSLVSKRGRTLSFEYDSGGNETSFTYSDVGRFEREYEAGRMTAQRLPSGLAYRYGYDSRGDLASEGDSRGHSVKVERDASGAQIGLVANSGEWVRATRDEAGRIVLLTNSSGKSRRFAYDARGALTDYVDARGRSRKMRYDRRGRLQSVTDSDGVSFLYDYDHAGRLVAVRRADRKEAGSFLSLPARYNPTLPPPALVQGVDCFFGGDGFSGGGGDMISIGSDPFDPKNCDDPFGVIGTGGGGGGGGGLLGGGGGGGSTAETREQCIERHYRACDSDFKACILAATALAETVVAACSLATALAGGLICVAIALAVAALGDESCYRNGQSCRLRAPDGCPP